jgi:hypothetical protein
MFMRVVLIGTAVGLLATAALFVMGATLPAVAQTCADVRAASAATRAYYAAQMTRAECLRVALVCRVSSRVCPAR